MKEEQIDKLHIAIQLIIRQQMAKDLGALDLEEQLMKAARSILKEVFNTIN